jgi:hypothetical protein
MHGATMKIGSAYFIRLGTQSLQFTPDFVKIAGGPTCTGASGRK